MSRRTPAALALGGMLSAGGCASTVTDGGVEPLRPACNLRSNCFQQRSVRTYQALNDTTLVVYVGASRCPFLVTLDGFFCDVRGSATIAFQDFDGQICNLERSMVFSGPFVRQDNDCRVRDVEPLNDDELLEILAEHGILAPPPIAEPGRLEVVEEGAPPAAAEQGAAASAD